jgi:DNA-directed RNA polymerase specialized sigma24 family protein
MLGSYAEAEDVVQEVYLRWHRIDHSATVDPRSFLARIATRLCLDVLKSARVRRETHVGPWLPEPLVEGLVDESSAEEELAGDLSVAMMLALEGLSPTARRVSRSTAFRRCASPVSTACRALPRSNPMAFRRSCLSKSRTGRSLPSM